MAYCKFCDKEVEPVLKKGRYYCPDCNKYVKMGKQEREEPQVSEIPPIKEEPEEREPKHYKKKEPETVQEGNTKLLITPKTTKYDASDLHMGEILINMGYAKDLNDLTRKNMKLAFSLMNMGAVGKQFNTMETNQEPNPERTMKQIQEQEMMKAYIEGMKKGNQTDPMASMMMMKMMENRGNGKDSGSNGFMDKILEMKMMQMMMGGQNSETSSLQKEIADLKHSMQMQQMLNQQQQTQQGNQSSQEFMQQMERIRAERDRAIKDAEIDAQKERDRNLQLAYENRKIELENRLKSLEKDKQKSGGVLSSQRIKDMKEEIAAIKDMSTLLGDKEKGTGEMVWDGIGKLGETVGPALVEALKQKKQQQVYQAPELPPMPEQLPQELPPQQPNPESQTLSELTPAEQQMADQYSQMYLHPSDNKK